MSKTVACKSATTIPLAVKNWLPVPQRFRVDIRAPDKDPSTQLSGHGYVDVPAALTREFALNVYCYKEGSTSAEVHFVNEKTGEYLYHRVALKAEAAGVLETVEMRAPLRQLCTHALPLTNPLDASATFTASCDNAEVAVPPSLTLGARASGELRVEWRPLLPRELTSRLKLSSPELGEFLYDLRLAAMPAGESKSLAFKVALGDAQPVRFRFANYLRRQETYKLSLADGAAEFEVDASVVAPAADGSQGAEVAVDVTFEPSKLGEVTSTLTASSAEGGEYVVALRGMALPPKPQGPVAIKGGGSAQVSFKNVFAAQADFAIVAEPAGVFSVAKSREAVPAKKSIPIGVSYKPTEPGAEATGKLTVTAVGTATAWVYYLQGTA